MLKFSVLLLAGLAAGSDPVPTPPVKPVPAIKFPAGPKLEVQAPSAYMLDDSRIFAVPATAPFFIDSSPNGYVSVKKEAGNGARIKGLFVDGGAVPEWRTFKEPLIYFIDPLKSGNVELLVRPVGATEGTLPQRFLLTVVKGGIVPTPTPTPTPTPGPKPTPTPTPTPTVSPIDASGLHVLIVYEDGKTITANQDAIISGAVVRQYLEANCAAVPGKTNRQFRMWPADVNAAGEQKVWQDAMKRPRTSYPWVVIGNRDVGGFEGPLGDMSPEQFVSLCEKYRTK